MEKFDYEMSLVGRLIYYYRTQKYQETHSTRYCQADIVRLKGTRYLENCKHCLHRCNKKNICSNTTLLKIEKGEIVHDECVYLGLCENIGFKYEMNNQIIKILEECFQMAVECFTTYSKEKMENLLEEVKKSFQQVFDYIYYSDLFECLIELLEYHLLRYGFKNTTLNKMKYLFEYLHSPYKEIVVLYIQSALYSLGDYKTTEYLEYIFNNNADEMFLQYRINYFFLDNGYLECKQYMENLYDNIESYSPYHHYVILNNMAFLAIEGEDYQKAVDLLLKGCEYLEEEAQIYPASIYAQANMKLGVLYRKQKKYQGSVDCFEKVAACDPNLLKYNILSFYHLLEVLGDVERIKRNIINMRRFKLSNRVVKECFKYYELKYSRDALNKELMIELSEFICDKLKPLFVKETDNFNILRNELIGFAKQSKAYKYLALFLDEVEV